MAGTVAAAVVAGTVMLAAAHVASLVSGHGRFPGSLSDSAQALVHLGARPGDPAAAWPRPEQQEALPGPVGFYACLALVIGVLVGVGVTAIRLVRKFRDARSPLGVRSYQGLAGRSGLRRLIVACPESGRLTLGRLDGALVAAEPQASLAVIGPTGCGKTVGFAIPALLEWDGPVICTSVKTDLVEHALARRAALGRVWVFDPSDAAGLGSPAWWTPLSTCRTWAGAARTAMWMCNSVPRRGEGANHEMWRSLSQKALGPHLYAAAVTKRTMRDVVRWIDRQEQDDIRAALCSEAGVTDEVEQRLKGPDGQTFRDTMEPKVRKEVTDGIRRVLAADPGRTAELAELPVAKWPVEMQEQLDERVWDEVARQVRERILALVSDTASRRGELDALVAVESLWAHEDRLRGSIYASLQDYLYTYSDPALAQILAGPAPSTPVPHDTVETIGIEPSSHAGRPVDDDEDDPAQIDLDVWLSGPNTIFVVAPSSEQALLRPVFTMLIGQAVRHAYTVANRNKGRLERPCLVLIDEAANVAPLPELPEYASTARSHGITLVSVWQDLAQIKDIYGERWHTVLNNHRARWFGTGIGDQDTLEYLSRMIGDVAFLERNYSSELAGLTNIAGSGHRSVSEHTTYRPAAPIDTLRRMRPGDGVLLYGSELPARIRLRPWHEDRTLRRLADGRGT